MKLNLNKPSVPETIQQKIMVLQHLLDQANDLRDQILEWYEAELKSYDDKVTPEDELYDPGTGIVVEGISYLAIMEALCVLQTANEVRTDRHL